MAGEENTETDIISKEEFSEAIAACCKDPQLARYFKLAPPGAKLFIGLGFYSTHFGDRADAGKYAVCQAEIEPSLEINDLQYLIRFETDSKTKQYLRKLLADRQEEAARPPEPEPAVEELLPPAAADGTEPEQGTKPAGPRPARPRIPIHSAPRESEHMRALLAATREERAWRPFVAVAVVSFALGCLVTYCCTRPPARGNTGAATRPAPAPVEAPRRDAQPQPPPATAPANTPAAPAPEPERPADSVPPAETNAPPADTADAPATAAKESGDSNDALTVQLPTGVAPGTRIVFTDGTRIVRHADRKLIEVPRRYSYRTAGVPKFWIYGKNPEAAALKDEAARKEWQELHDAALRQEQAQAGRGTVPPSGPR